MANRYQCEKCGRLIKKIDFEAGIKLCPACRDGNSEIKYSGGRVGKHECKICDGISIKVNDKDESDFLKAIYKDYKQIDFEIPDPNAQLTILLTARLEHKRLSNMLVEKRIDISDRTKITQSMTKLSDDIKKIQNSLGITQEKMKDKNKSTQEIYKEHMLDSYNYYLENKGHRSAIGICKNCNDRIIMYGNFETLEHELVEELEMLEDEILDSEYEIDEYIPPKKKMDFNKIKDETEKKFEGYSKELIHYIIRLKYLLLVRKFPEAYLEYHRKNIMEALQ